MPSMDDPSMDDPSMDDVVVIGSGGHAKVCIELLRAMGKRVAFCIGGPEATGTCLGVPVLGGDEHLERLRSDGFMTTFVAIGDNALRQRLAASAVAQGFELVNAISPRAVVSPSARLGVGIAIMEGVVVNAETEISDLAIINTGATVDHDCRIGRSVHIAPQCGLAGNVIVGDRTFLGVGCSVVPEQTIGTDAIIGAGSVVITDLPDSVTAVGVPARVIKSRK